MHVKGFKDLIGQSFLFGSLGRRFCLALWEKGTLLLLVLNETYLGLDGMIPDGLHTRPR